MAQNNTAKIGSWSFIGALILAILVGLFPGVISETAASNLFIVLGLIVGFLNISPKETNTFLIATIALIVVGTGSLQRFFGIGVYIEPIVTNVVAVAAPAALIVALRSIYDLGRGEN